MNDASTDSGLARDRHLFGPGPKRILSLDGGGVRGAISVAFLERIEKMAALLTQAVEEAIDGENARGNGPRITARIKEIGSRPSGELADNAPLLEAIRAVDAHLGIRSRLDCSSTDANIPLSLGLQAVSIGAGGQGGGAHTPDEWYLPEGRDLALRRVLLAVCLLLNAE